MFESAELGDARLTRRLNLICNQMISSGSAIVNKFSKGHTEKMGAYRFLNNPNVSYASLLSSLRGSCLEKVCGKSHILCIQDTSEINYTAHLARIKKKTDKPGIVSRNQCGIFLHPVLVVDAQTCAPLGFPFVKQWNRDPDAPSREERNYRQQPIEEKESYRWIESSLECSDNLPKGVIKTIVADREADAFEFLSRVPGENVHVLIRSSYDRLCECTDEDSRLPLNILMERSPKRAEYSFLLRPGTNRKKRVAHMELRFEKVTLCAPRKGAPSSKERVTLYCIYVKEKSSSVPADESPIEWRLFTTHTVETVQQALECIQWYRCRWFIEELFRVLKKKGFLIEDAQLESLAALEKLILISLQVALHVMMLKLAFDEEDERLSATLYFSEKEIALLHILTKKHSGKTKLQQNPYKAESMAWAAWTIARMGAWSGYKSQSIPGHITLKNGLEHFYIQFELYEIMC